jgi:hypothetical protein
MHTSNENSVPEQAPAPGATLTMAKATAVSQHAQVTSSAHPSIITATGDIRFVPIRLWAYPSAFVSHRLQQLHDRAVGARDEKKLSPKRAKVAYRMALESALGGYVALSDRTRLQTAGAIIDAVAKLGRIDGLESLFLTAMVTATSLGKAELVARGEKLWKAHGAPARIGGGRKAALVFDTTTNRVAYLGEKGLASLGHGGANANVVGGTDMYEAIAGRVSALDAGIAQDGDGVCVTVFAFVGAVCGAVVGAGASSPSGPGAVAGGAAGGFIGERIGKADGEILCGMFDTGPEAGSYSGAGGAGAGGTGDPYQDPVDGDQGSSQQGDQSSSQQDEKNTCEPDDPENGDNSSGGDNSGGDDNSGGGDDNGGGMPDPDDPHGFPNPDDPRGTQAFSNSYAMGPGVASHMSRLAGGGVLLTGMPQLAPTGTIATAGYLAGLSDIASTVSQTVAQTAGRAAARVGP